MLAQVPEWLNDGAVVFGFIASVLAVLGGFIAITHYFTKRFKNEVGEVIRTLVQKVDSIEVRQRAHLMDLGIVDDEPEAGK